MKYVVYIIALIAASFIALPASAATNFPCETIKIVVPYSPGGTTDTLGRLFGKALSDSLDVNVVVENKPGAGATIGVSKVARAKPDGCTLLLASVTPIVISPITYSTAQYDPLKDLQPISLVASQPLAIYASTHFPANTIEELLRYGNKYPNKTITFATYGTGSLSHLAGALFEKKTGMNLKMIPFRGSAPAIVDVIAGRVDIGFDMVLPLIEQHKAGKTNILAILGSPLPELPNVPSIHKTLPDYGASSWYGFIAPAGTPQKIVNKLNQALHKAVEEPKIQKMLADFSLTPRKTSPEEFKEIIRKGINVWKPVIEDLGLKNAM